MPDFEELQQRYRKFTRDRDWAQFHDPKSIILALVGEVGELAELFQWVPADRAKDVFSTEDRQRRAAEEMSDVLIYLIALSQALGVDLIDAAHAKLTAAELRFPVEDFRGLAPFKG
ncbi:MAG TPA: nucleotide pyrophosphohydrolase [Candidatus Luteococcus avicola]|nr:nucleotide pyrophosphohydrolase [Candidatus Luteococcus avicola]